MLKIRVIPTLLFKGFGLVKGVSFDSWRRIGTVMQSVKVFNMRDVDELVFLDIEATRLGRRPDISTVDEIADECRMPLAVGGGIKSTDDIRELLAAGADKVVINSAAFADPELVRSASRRFGRQCIVASIDARRAPDGTYEVFTESGTRPTGLAPVDAARMMEERGAGEVLITSIDRDGTMAGYDTALCRSVADAVSIPVIASGGAGGYGHMGEVLLGSRVSAVAAASIFQFTQSTPIEAKRYLRQQGLPVRL